MIVRGDARRIPLRDQTVQCVVTSPSYFQLRDYQCGKRQIGLETTPEVYLAALVEVFREVRRVLRHDGVLWLALGDSYWGTSSSERSLRHPALKPKDLIGIPWRVALALQADGLVSVAWPDSGHHRADCPSGSRCGYNNDPS